MTKILYDSTDYAQSRLMDTVVRVNGNPVIVVGIADLAHIEVQTLIKSRRKTVTMQDLDLEPVELGYVNYNGCAIYASRKPKRQDWRQGLRYENMDFSSVQVENRSDPEPVLTASDVVDSSSWSGVQRSRTPIPPRPRSRQRSAPTPTWAAIYQTICGNYPTLESCLEKLKSCTSIAWSRDFALRSSGDVEYLGRKVVGKLVDGRVLLDGNFEYLQERLSESFQ